MRHRATYLVSTAGPAQGASRALGTISPARAFGARWERGPSCQALRIPLALSLIDPVAQDDANQAGPPSPAPTGRLKQFPTARRTRNKPV
jgi:hypothetical protein